MDAALVAVDMDLAALDRTARTRAPFAAASDLVANYSVAAVPPRVALHAVSARIFVVDHRVTVVQESVVVAVVVEVSCVLNYGETMADFQRHETIPCWPCYQKKESVPECLVTAAVVAVARRSSEEAEREDNSLSIRCCHHFRQSHTCWTNMQQTDGPVVGWRWTTLPH